jgi:thymidylate synthase
MNNIDQQYLSLLQDILDNGVEKNDRTGVGTCSVFGRHIRHKMSDGFPLLTTKKMAWKSIVVELLWFLRGDTNIKFLVDDGCNIWNGDAYKSYVNKWHQNFKLERVRPDENQRPLSLEEYVEFARNNSLETLKSVGGFDLGPIYGHQWRRWQGYVPTPNVHPYAYGSLWYDQIARLIHDLKTNPDSRRLMVNAWHVDELDKMALPPCHYGFQVYTRELGIEERRRFKMKRDNIARWMMAPNEQMLDNSNVPRRAISLMWNQRSVDTPLGLPFNIASYGLLLMLLAKEVNMVPDELIGNLGDCHIYNNQIEGIQEQLTREPYPLPQVKLDFEYRYIDGYLTDWESIQSSDIKLLNYQSHSSIKIPLSN